MITLFTSRNKYDEESHFPTEYSLDITFRHILVPLNKRCVMICTFSLLPHQIKLKQGRYNLVQQNITCAQEKKTATLVKH
jgi:hypothetical protein